jgi:hypothetical protein
MCRETKRRIAISTDTSRGKQRYSQSGETIVSCNHCHKTHRFDNRDIFSFPQVGPYKSALTGPSGFQLLERLDYRSGMNLGAHSFDNLVGAEDDRRRCCEPELLGGLEVDDEFELDRTLDRQVSGLCTL